MKSMAIAAFAALLAVARISVAASTGPAALAGPADDEVLRAAAEGRALVATMQNNARGAREALELARQRRRPAEVRCSDEALSRADVALRRGRDDAAEMAALFAANERPAARAALLRLRLRADASREAAVAANRCSDQQVAMDRTVVIVRVDPALRAGLAGQLDGHP